MMTRVPVAELQGFSTAVLQALGLGARDAAIVAAVMSFADRRGIASHGVALLPYYAALIDRGADPKGRPSTARDRGAALVVDGGNALGPVVADFGMRAAVERAAEAGIAAVAIRGSNHCGAMSAYATIALERGMIGVATTNALPTMAPAGGASRIVGMNPIAVAIPAGEEPPFVLDASFAAAARGKIVLRAQSGEALPPGWALDASGAPTTDAAAALAGLLVPIGGAKGIGLAITMGVLSSLLSGAAYGTELGSLESGPEPGRDGHFVMAIDVAAFADPGEFGRRMDAVIREIRGSSTSGSEPVRVPGDRARAAEAAAVRDGVSLADATVEQLDALAGRLGVPKLARGSAT